MKTKYEARLPVRLGPEWDFSLWFALLRTHLIKRDGCVARDFTLRQGERRENILYGSLSDEQRRRRVKDQPTLRAERIQSLFMRWVLVP
jgi:hypothetical protein